mgnify:CR=1 FL=1
MQQAYDIAATYRENFQRGPQLEPLPVIPSNTVNERVEFLGFSVNSRLGIAAGLLLNAKWIEGYAARGWDLLSYKTVRSAARAARASTKHGVRGEEAPRSIAHKRGADRGLLVDPSARLEALDQRRVCERQGFFFVHRGLHAACLMYFSRSSSAPTTCIMQ